MKRYVLLFLLLPLLAGTGCKKETEPEYDPSVALTLKDVSYGSQDRQKYDLYLPANRSTSNTPVLFLIHGGAWSAGSKEDYNSLIPGIQATFPAYAIVNIGYRLYTTGSNEFPAQENDVKDCIEKVMSLQNQYAISNRTGVWGGSAGAHLALLYAYKYGDTPYAPRVVIDMVGPTEMISLYQTVDPSLNSLLLGLIGDPSTSDSVLYKSSSPMEYVSASSPPTLILHGTADAVVPYQQAEMLDARLTQLNVTHTYKLYPGADHSLGTVAEDAVGQIVLFLQTHLN